MQPIAKLFRVVVKLDPISKYADGSTCIEKPIATLDKEKHARHEGVIVSLGEYAFKEYQLGHPSIGDRVIFAQYSGEFIEDKEAGEDYRIINDLDIMAIMPVSS